MSGPPASRVRVDAADECIWRDGERISVPPKAFLVLRCLMAQPDQLVTKQQLMETVWPDAYVADGVLSVAINQLRLAFADDSKVPRYIETVHRRGFRWMGADSVEASTSERIVPEEAEATCVGRDSTIAELESCYARAAAGKRQMVFVTGDPGVGKTTVVDHFVTSLAPRSSPPASASRDRRAGNVLVCRGQCTESHIAGEAYRPVLEAIESLLRGAAGAMRPVFTRHAPTWMLQMPELSTAQELEELTRTVTASTSQRMQRELERAIEAAAADRTIVIVLEDLHWSDPATVDLLWALAARREAAHLMIIGTYRPVDAIANQHPIVRMTRELTGKRQCIEIALDGLDTTAVDSYLELCFAGHRLPADFAARLQTQTSGNPLFMLNALAHFQQRGWLSRSSGAWTCSVELDTLDAIIPDGTRDIVAFRLDQLPRAMQELLEAASIAGETFTTQALAAALDRSCDEVETECVRLGGTLFLRNLGDIEWPDGSRGCQHGFRHALYRQVLAARVTPTRRRLLHQRIAARLHGGYGDRAGEIAGQLAFHREHAGEWLRAVEHIDVLVSQAYARCATQEAEALTARAVALLKRLPPSPDRQERSLRATIDYAMALSASRGALSIEAAQVFDEARRLGGSIPTSPEHVLSLVGLAVGALMHGRLQEARRMGEELLALAAPDSPQHAVLSANLAVGTARLHVGEVEASIEHLKRGLAVVENDPAAAAEAGAGAVVGIRASLGTALTVAGRSESGWASIMAAVEAAKAAQAPWYQGFALATASAAATFRRDTALTRLYSEELLACCDAHGLPYWPVMQRVNLAWADVVETRDPARIDALVRAVEEMRPVVRLGSPRAFSLLADAHLCVGRLDGASRALDEGFDAQWEERIFHAELWRQRAAVLLARPTTGKKQSAEQHEEVERMLMRGREIASLQGARLFGLRITVDLCRIWHATGRTDEARQQLGDAIAGFPEGLADVDMRAARELLRQVGG